MFMSNVFISLHLIDYVELFIYNCKRRNYFSWSMVIFVSSMSTVQESGLKISFPKLIMKTPQKFFHSLPGS